jgi:hypothetical protein
MIRKLMLAALAALALSGFAFAQTLTPVIGTIPHSKLAPATPAGTLIKAGAGKVFHVNCGSSQAAVAVVKLYDSATAPTCGSGTPFARLVCPGASAGAVSQLNLSNGKLFANGLGYCVTGALADADTTARSAPIRSQ